MHHLPPICIVFFRICFQGHKPRWAHISCGPGKGLRSRRYAEESTGELTVGSLFAGKETLRVVFEIPSTTVSVILFLCLFSSLELHKNKLAIVMGAWILPSQQMHINICVRKMIQIFSLHAVFPLHRTSSSTPPQWPIYSELQTTSDV